jgi:hypothetical protein
LHLAIVKGSSDLPAGSKIYFYAYGNRAEKYAGAKTLLDSSVIGSNGDYSFSITLDHPTVFDLRTCTETVVCANPFLTSDLFISPGAQITLNFKGKRNNPEIINPSTDAERLNDYILKSVNKFYKDTEAAAVFYIGANYMDCSIFILL